MSAKLLLHWLQLYGFSPVWVLMWPWSSQGREKDLPQKGHLQPAVWVLMCMFRAAGLLYSLLHTVQLWAGPDVSGAPMVITLAGVIGSIFTLAAMDRSRGSLCSAALAGDQKPGLVCEVVGEGEDRYDEGEELSAVRGDTEPDLVWKAGL